MDASDRTPDRSSSAPRRLDDGAAPRRAMEDDWSEPELTRPERPPLIPTKAPVLLSTRPTRTHVASERVWTASVLVGLLAGITAWLSHNAAVKNLVLEASTAATTEAMAKRAAQILHLSVLGLLGATTILQGALVTTLRKRRVATRVILTILALGNVALLSPALDVLVSEGWLGTAVRVCLPAQVVLSVIGSILMWIPDRRNAD